MVSSNKAAASNAGRIYNMVESPKERERYHYYFYAQKGLRDLLVLGDLRLEELEEINKMITKLMELEDKYDG